MDHDPATPTGRAALRELAALVSTGRHLCIGIDEKGVHKFHEDDGRFLAAARTALPQTLDEIDRLTAEMMSDDEQALADAERSSAFEAAAILLKALGWKSGGLAAAAMEIVARCERLTAENERLKAAMVLLLDQACNGGHHEAVLYSHGYECRCESCAEARLALKAMEAARAALGEG